MSLLRKAKIDPSQVLPQVPMKIEGDLTMKTKPIKILDRDEKLLRNKRVLGESIVEKLLNRRRNMGKRI